MTQGPPRPPRRRALSRRALILVLAAALAVSVAAATISLLKPPQREVTERVSTDQGTVTVVYRPKASARDLGFKPYRGTVTESYFYQVRDARNRPGHTVMGMEIVVASPLSQIKAHFVKALPGAKARAVGNRKVGRYIITRDKGNEAIVIEASRPAGKSSTIRIRRVVQGKAKLTPKPTPMGSAPP